MYLHSYKLNLPTKLVKLDICAGDPFDSIEEYCESEVLHDLKAERPEDILSWFCKYLHFKILSKGLSSKKNSWNFLREVFGHLIS